MPRPGTGGARSRRRYKMDDMQAAACQPARRSLELRIGSNQEAPLGDDCCEFPYSNGRFAGRHYRYVVTGTAKPGWFLFDGLMRHGLRTGATWRFRFPDGVYGSEAPIAPRPGSS